MKEMSVKLSPSQQSPSAVWLPLLFGLAVICLESTRTMGAWHTQIWVSHVLAIFGSNDASGAYELNHVLRKTGHFLGYGMLAVLFARVWLPILLRFRYGSWTRPRVQAAAFGVLCACLVASLDEIHQSFLPGRTSSVIDMLIDTAGALLWSVGFVGFLGVRRQTVIGQR